MRQFPTFATTFLACFGLLGLASTECAASTIQMDLNSIANGVSGLAFSTNSGGSFDTAYFVGQCNVNLHNPVDSGTPTASNLVGQQVAYCCQVLENIFIGSTNNVFDVKTLENVPDQPPIPGPMGGTRADMVRRLYGYANGAQYLNTFSNEQAAAFQLAIWEITFDGGSGLNQTGGIFQIRTTGTGAIDATTNGYLTTYLTAAAGSGPMSTDLVGLTNDNIQDFIVHYNPSLVVPVPPSAILMGLGGLGLLGKSLRRRFVSNA